MDTFITTPLTFTNDLEVSLRIKYILLEPVYQFDEPMFHRYLTDHNICKDHLRALWAK
jgi:hypothetical protein